MTKKIALLRGINVGGKRKILMSDLKLMFEDLNFSNVITYIQSGNVIFNTDTGCNSVAISQKIEEAIHKKFGFNIPIVVKTANELETSIYKSPFYREGMDVDRLHLTFLHKEPTKHNIEQVETCDYTPDKFAIRGKYVFIYCEGKYHRSKLTNDFFEKKLKVNSTTRNWKTVLQLLSLSK